MKITLLTGNTPENQDIMQYYTHTIRHIYMGKANNKYRAESQ